VPEAHGLASDFYISLVSTVVAATRRYELPGTADEDSGFRCARSVSAWPDTDFWLSQLQADQLNAQDH